MLEQLLLMFGLYTALGIAEYFFEAEKNQTMEGKIRNLVLTAIFYFGGLVCLLYVYKYFPSSGVLANPNGIFLSGLYIALSLLLSDIIFYWYHRAQHRFAFLWALHELHHSDTELNVTTSMRTYFLERPLQAIIISLPISYVLGTGGVVFATIVLMWLFFTHANLRLHLGWLTKVICGPQTHRIHHSVLPAHRDKNFAQFFPCIDILFGTYHHPAKNEFPSTGTTHLATNASIKTILVRPFTIWLRLLKKNNGRHRS